ncbi:MAG TPA: hypothetical protein VFX76_15855 [Roseiflexaceae bacterium]|nr:hypothetical protein [Roseiflexaceae bacterium]
MINERHPLLAAGAGQNTRMLPDEAVVPYCDALGDRLSHLGSALQEEQRAGRLSIAAFGAARAFLHEIRATLLVMALKHGRQLLDVEPVPLTIDPTESGMPTFKDFWTLREDRDHAEQQLSQIPTREQLIEQANDAIFAGNRPLKQQILWLQRSYMERLAATPVVADFRQGEPICLDAKRRDKVYAVSWTGVIHSINLFECCTLHFVESGGWHVTGGARELRDLVDDLAGGRNSLQEMVGLINQTPWIVPQTLERVTLGPYHHEWTENDELVQRAFAAATTTSPFLLRASIERAATTRAIKPSVVDKLFGRTPMEAGPSVRSKVLLAPLAIKQLLGDADEDGHPCAVYGVTKEGDLVN